MNINNDEITALETHIKVLSDSNICDYLIVEDCKEIVKTPRMKIHLNDLRFYPEKSSILQLETKMKNYKNMIRSTQDIKSSIQLEIKNHGDFITKQKKELEELLCEIKLVLKDKNEITFDKKKMEDELSKYKKDYEFLLPSSRTINNSQPNHTNRLMSQRTNIPSTENKNNTIGNITEKDLFRIVDEKKKNIKILTSQQEKLEKNVTEFRKSKENKIVILSKLEKENQNLLDKMNQKEFIITQLRNEIKKFKNSKNNTSLFIEPVDIKLGSKSHREESFIGLLNVRKAEVGKEGCDTAVFGLMKSLFNKKK